MNVQDLKVFSDPRLRRSSISINLYHAVNMQYVYEMYIYVEVEKVKMKVLKMEIEKEKVNALKVLSDPRLRRSPICINLYHPLKGAHRRTS